SVDGRSQKKCPLVALLAPMEGPKPLLAPMEGPKPLHKQSWARFIKERHLFNQSISANGDGQWTNTEIRASAFVSATSASRPSASRASASGASASGATAIREHVGVLNMDDDPLVDMVVDVDVDDDDDDGNSRAHKIHDEVRPKKKEKTSRVTMDDLIVD
ncbi:hypothetical protein Tco_1470022, partial [Tanacetum coccineum]